MKSKSRKGRRTSQPRPTSLPTSDAQGGSAQAARIGARIAEARGQMTQRDFADLVGVHVNTLSRYERGEHPPRSDFLNAASSRADVNPLWLLHGEGPRSFLEASGGGPDVVLWGRRGITMVQAKGRSQQQLEEPRVGYGDGNLDRGPTIKGKVPLISWVHAGSFATIVDNFVPGHADEYVDTTVPIHQHTYALRVSGDSMTNPAGDPTFPHGSIIVVEPDAVGDLVQMAGSFVIVKRTSDDEATFKQLVKDAGRYYLKPLNPRYPVLELREDDVFCGVVREKVMRFF